MTADTPPPAAKPRHRRLGRGVAWVLNGVLGLVTVAVLLAGAAVLYLKSRPVTAPDWAQARIEARLAEALPQVRVRFGEMAFLMAEGWRPRVRLRDVVLRKAGAEEILRLSEFNASLSTRALLEGQLRPKDIALSGIIARLRRSADGSFAVQAGGSGPAAERQAAGLPQLVGQVDDVLQSPALAALRKVDLRALTLRYEDARSGRAWTVDGGRLRLLRDGDDLSLSADLAILDGGVGVATLAANYTSRIGETAAEFGATFEDMAAQDIAAQGPAVAWLGVLQAPISGAVRSGLKEDGSFAPMAATLQISAGAVQPNAGTAPIPFDQARSYFSYDPAERLLRFDELSVRSKWITGQATGEAVLGLNPTGDTLTNLVGQISLSDLVANPGDLYEAPVDLHGVAVDFRLRPDPFEVTIGRAQVTDQGRTLLASGSVAAGSDGWRVALDGRMDQLDPDRLMTLWPERAVPRTRKWLSQNLKAGEIHNIDVAVRRAPDAAPQTYLAFDFEETSVKFMKTLPPITRGKGHFSLAEGRMVISLDQGRVTPPEGGDIAMAGSSFIIPDVRARDGTPAVVRLNTRSDIHGALALLNMPPLSVMDKARLPVDLADGQAQIAATLALPLRTGQRVPVQYHATGALSAVRSGTLVKGRDLRADRLRLEADNGQVMLTGTGTLDEVPFEARFYQPVGKGAGPGRLSADVALTPDALTRFGITLPPGSVAGRGEGQVDVTLARGKPPELTLQSDLEGLRVAVPQVSWVKPASQKGRLEVTARLAPVVEVPKLEIAAKGLEAKGSVSFNADKSLERVRFDRLEVGNWLNVPLDLLGQGSGKPVQVALRGGTLDLRRAEFGPSPSGGKTPPMLVNLDRLQITDTISLSGMQGTFDTGGGLDGSFAALLNGVAPVQGRVVPQDGRSAVRMVSDDAGAVLRAAGLLKQVVGGTLSLVLLPVGSGGAFDGQLDVTDVRVKNAPGIAALLNAISVVGLINELAGDGIYFEDVEAKFRLTPKQLTLTEASAVGASMGLSMDGTYALDSGVLAMQGVISPVYLLNGIGSLLTRKGEGLIGFNYALNGSAKDPKVSVNPLSALTPAMFREIFRAPAPDLPVVEGVSESTLPPDDPAPQRPVARTYEGR